MIPYSVVRSSTEDVPWTSTDNDYGKQMLLLTKDIDSIQSIPLFYPSSPSLTYHALRIVFIFRLSIVMDAEQCTLSRAVAGMVH